MTSTYQAIVRRPFARTCTLTLAVVSASLVAQPASYDVEMPLRHATLFAPGIISTGDYESHPTFTPDGREIYFLKMAPNFSRWTIFFSRYNGGRWAPPGGAPFSRQYPDAHPYINADRKHIHFLSPRPLTPGRAPPPA